jgi:hypothetical protein
MNSQQTVMAWLSVVQPLLRAKVHYHRRHRHYVSLSEMIYHEKLLTGLRCRTFASNNNCIDVCLFVFTNKRSRIYLCPNERTNERNNDVRQGGLGEPLAHIIVAGLSLNPPTMVP